MAKILIVEDDIPICTVLVDLLELDKHVVESVHTGSEGMDRIKFYPYDLVILDWGLPDTTGMEICQKYRAGGGKMPILLLTGRDQVHEKEQGFEAGVDDYLTKPFSSAELRARVRALLRRIPEKKLEHSLSFGEISLTNATFQATIAGKQVELLPQEFNLLSLLMKQPNEMHSIETIFEAIWDGNGASIDSLRACVKRLRKKVEVPGSKCAIRSVYGKGYLIEESRDDGAQTQAD